MATKCMAGAKTKNYTLASFIQTIIYSHTYTDNKTWSWRMAEGFAVSVISNSTLSVDTFFFLSGFLVAYMYYVAHKDDRPTKTPDYKLKVLEFVVTVVRRFIRYVSN